MRQLVIEDKLISENTHPFVIAEIGHNHQGKLENAIKLIRAAAEAGASAVKFQKRNNRTLFTPEMFNQVYNSENSFGDTYGNHREALELNESDYKLCISEARRLGITFFATAFDFKSADFLSNLDLPAFKIASGDLQNLPLLKYIAKFNKPMIVSTGGANYQMIKNAVETIRTVHNNFAILQCTASYPAKFEHLNLKVISELREMYPENIIGYSGHDNGIAMAIVAYTLGARIIEKHFTLNRTLKGTDHAFSLEPQGLQKMIRDLNRAAVAIGDGKKIIYEEEIAPIEKMGKMIVAAKNLPAGHILKLEDLDYRSPFKGLPPSENHNLVGKVLKIEVNQFTPLTLDILE